MEEIGIDISGHRSKHLEEFLDQKVHTVVTVCGYAEQACPIFPGMVKRYHWGFDDPAKATGSEEEVLAVFRRVRDEMVKVFGAYAAGINLGSSRLDDPFSPELSPKVRSAESGHQENLEAHEKAQRLTDH